LSPEAFFYVRIFFGLPWLVVAVRKRQQQLLIKPYLGFLFANLVWEKRIGAGFYQGS
jgi:hypothetical protein